MSSVGTNQPHAVAFGAPERDLADLLGGAVLRARERFGGGRVFAILREIERAPFEPPEQVRANQMCRLSALLDHAERRVPYYRELFRTLGITSRDIRTLDDFARLPVLTKEIIRERGGDLVRDDVPLESLSAHHSGGSTGVPLTFYRDREYMDASDAGVFRYLIQSGWQPGEMIAFFWGFNDRLNEMPAWKFEARQLLRRKYQFDPFRSGARDMDGWFRRWRTLKPKVALGYASTIARFAAHIQERGERVAPLRGVFTTAEKLYAPQREIIEQVFGCTVYDAYGSSEVQNIAVGCPRGRMHVNADYVVLETDAEQVGDDDARPLIVTSLWNYAMPFIRYRNEDCGSLSDERCACGNNFPLMNLNVARTSDNFRFANGAVVHGEFFTHLMYGSEGITNFQFHQTAPDEIRLLIVPAGADADARRRAVEHSVAEIERLAPGTRVSVEEVEAIPLSAAGKHRFTRSDVKA